MWPVGAIENSLSMIPDLGQILNFYGGVDEFFRWILSDELMDAEDLKAAIFST